MAATIGAAIVVACGGGGEGDVQPPTEAGAPPADVSTAPSDGDDAAPSPDAADGAPPFCRSDAATTTFTVASAILQADFLGFGAQFNQVQNAAQHAWFDLVAARNGYVATVKWDAYFAKYDNSPQAYDMIGAPQSGWPTTPIYELTRMLARATCRTHACTTSPAVCPASC